MNSRKVSVIMSVFNEKSEWLQTAISSVLTQTYNNLEFIIIMDNPNNIELINLLKTYEINDNRVKVYINEKNKGLVYSLNKALKICTGDYIARMDADDISISTRIKKQVEFMNNNPHIDLCATGVIIMDENEKELYKANIYGSSYRKAEKSLIYRNILPHGSWMFKREILDCINQYNNVSQAEDYDFLFRLLDCNKKICIIPEYLFKYRLRQNGISFKNIFRQKVIMKSIAEEYIKSKKMNIKYETPININDLTLGDDEEKYFTYQKLYTNAISDIRNKYFVKGFSKIVRCIVGCKYRRAEIKNTIMLKLINKM